jgi:hypothetical protein
MKMILFAFMAITLFSSCGLKLKDHNQKEGTREVDTTDPAFNSYVQKFESKGKTQTGDSNFQVGDIPINFKELGSGDVQGVCNEYTDGTKEILIKKSWWDSVDEGFRESLLFHELGHCRLGRTHNDDMIQVGSNQYKASLMHSYIVESPDYTLHQNDYFRELFTQDRTTLVNSLSRTTANSK